MDQLLSQLTDKSKAKLPPRPALGTRHLTSPNKFLLHHMNYDNPEPLAFVTPVGEFRYGWLVEPDTKFDKCDYKVEVLIPAEKGAKIVDDLEAYLTEWKQACMKARPSKTDWKTVESLPWGTDEDSEGNACVKLKCKRKAKGIRKSHPARSMGVQGAVFDAKAAL